MSNALRNTLNITETKNILCAEHAARLLVAECWWAIIPNKDGSYAKDGDAQPFWALINATLELGMPLGYEKVENHLRKLVSVPHSDPEKVLRGLIKAQPRTSPPDLRIIQARSKHIPKYNNKGELNMDEKQMFELAQATYNAELEAELERVEATINDIMRARPVAGDTPFETTTKLGAFDEATGEYEEYEVTFGEWETPIDRIIEFGERQLKFMASNTRIPDIIFGAESALWEGELNALASIVQQRENEGAGEGSRALDEKLLSASGMQAGGQAGK